MDNFEYMPQIGVTFVLTKRDTLDFERHMVTQRLKIIPTKTEEPTLSKGTVKCEGNPETVSAEFTGLTVIPYDSRVYRLLKHANWSVTLPRMNSWCITQPLQELERLFYDKQEAVCEICEMYNLHADVIIRIYAQANDMPEVTLSNESISFWAAMGVTIGFEFCLD